MRWGKCSAAVLALFLIYVYALAGCGRESAALSADEYRPEEEAEQETEDRTASVPAVECVETEGEFQVRLDENQAASFSSASYSVVASCENGYCPVLIDCPLVPDENGILRISKNLSVLTMRTDTCPQDMVVPYVRAEYASGGAAYWETNSLSLCSGPASVFDERYQMSIGLGENADHASLDYEISLETDPLDLPRAEEIAFEYWDTIFIYHAYYSDIFTESGEVLPLSQWSVPSYAGSCVTCSDVEKKIDFQQKNIGELDEAFFGLITITDADGTVSASGLLTLQEGQDLSYDFGGEDSGMEETAATEYGEMVFSVYEDHAVLTQYEGEDETLVIPETVGGVPVTVIGAAAVSNQTTLRQVHFPSSLKQIGSEAFYGTRLDSLTFPEGLEYIGHEAFGSLMTGYFLSDENTADIGTLYLGEHVRWIGGGAFDGYCVREYSVSPENPYYRSLDGCIYTEDLTFLLACPTGKNGAFQTAEGVKSIHPYAFKNNGYFSDRVPDASGITSLVLADSVEAFSCTYLPQNLEQLSVGSGLEQWESIGNCSALSEVSVSSDNLFYRFEEGAIYDKDRTALLCWLSAGQKTEYTFPETLTRIADDAFLSGSRLQTIRIPENCTLSQMTPGDLAVQLNRNPYLTHIHADQGNPSFSSVDGVLFSSDQSVLICYPAGRQDSDYTVPGSAETIALYAFCQNQSVETLRLPASLSSLALPDESGICLSYLQSLTDLYVEEDNPTFYSDGPFLISKTNHALIFSSGNYPDSVLFIPDGVRSIPDDLFHASDLNKITEIHFPDGLQSIGAGNFNQIDQSDQWDILDVYLPDTLEDISDASFQDSPGIVIHADEDSAAAAFARRNEITLQQR